MRRSTVVLALVLMCSTGSVARAAQTETPVASPSSSSVATPQATPPVDLAGVTPLPLTGDRRAAFEAYVVTTLQTLHVPGAAIAVIAGGDVVYLQGFGTRKLGGTEAVTPDTLMMIGSVNKSMTSMMTATLVDDGWLAWDTPVVDLLPSFAVADPQITQRLSIADSFCACTGLPQRDTPLIFTFDALSPERLIASVNEFPLTAPFGETYQYSNQLYAIGGYAATIAAGAAPDDLFDAYRAVMRDRILNPIGMDRSTFALDEVLASGDYALPNAGDLAGQTNAISLLDDDAFVNSVAPAGALWSSARDMARYIQTQVADGVAPDGTRVVSAENLARTRAGRVAMPTDPNAPPLFTDVAQAYAMGWAVGTYKGQPLFSHSGGTLGFTSEVAFLPEADVGIVLLTNGGTGADPFNLAVQFRLLELVFDQPPEFDPLLHQFIDGMASQGAQIQAHLGQVDPTAIAPYLGRYTNPLLGEADLSLDGGRLILDVGELRSELRPVMDEAGTVAFYLFTDPPLASSPVPVMFQPGSDGRPEIVLTVANDNGATYALTHADAGAAATPAP